MKEITGNSAVLVHMEMKLEDGSLADSSKVAGKPVKFFLGNGSLSEAMEEQLIGQKEGATLSFTLPPKDVFGEVNPDNIHYLDISRFPASDLPKVGQIMGFSQPGGGEIPGVIREVAGDSVTVDFNHPLAGREITFEIEVLEVVES